jgi:nitrite reductase (NADH) large subunit
MKHQLAIIGNGMATAQLLDDLARRGGLGMFTVSVFGEEPHGAYNRILLNRVMLGESPDAITLKPAAWYAEKGVKFFPGRRVSRLSHAAHRLWTDDDKEHYFDVAVFATGSESWVPPIEGARTANGALKPGAFAYRTIADVEKMRAHALKSKRAIVIGGGLLGLEAAKGLADMGVSATVVHLFDTLMNRQVDKLGGQFLKRGIEKLGITVRTSANSKAVVGKAKVEGLELGGGEVIPTDMIVFAAGIKARTDLAADSDVPVNRGIVVDDRMETQLPGLYAVGECAEHAGTVYGTVQPIYEQTAVLADVLTGANPAARYRGSKVYTKLKVAGVEVASMGDVEGNGPDDECVQIVEEKRGVYRKLVVRGNRLIGAVLVGDSSAAAGLVRLFDAGTPLPANRLDVLASGDAIPGAGPAADPEVCNCHHVTKTTLVAAIRGGCDSLARIADATSAGTGCGSCRGQLTDLILKTCGPAVAARGKG